MKFFDNFLGKTVLVVLTLIVVVGILIPGIEATLGWATTIDNWTLDQAAEYWESQGYVAYASPDGTLHVYDVEPNDDDTYDLGTAVLRFQDIYGVDVYVDGVLYVGSRSISDNGTQLKVDDTFIGAPGTPDYVVGGNTATDDVPGSTGYWVKSGSTGQVVRSTASPADDDIQYAITALPSGGKVLCGAGIFPISVAISIVTSNITLEGQGANTILRTDVPNVHTISVVGLVGGHISNVTVRNLQVWGDAAHGVGNPLNGLGVAFTYVDDLLAENLYVHDCISSGIYVNSGLRGVISHNVVTGCAFGGITLGAMTNTLVDGNTSYSNITGWQGAYAGIQLLDASCVGVRIIGNTCYSNAHWGIFSNGYHTTINSNFTYSNLQQGIVLNSPATDSIISGNRVLNNTGEGIRVEGLTDLVIGNNILYDENTPPTQLSGIGVVNCSRVTIVGNYAHRHKRVGIRISNTSSYITITGNTCLNNGQNTDGEPYGIYLADTTYSVVSGNTAGNSGAATQTHGIIEAGVTDYNSIVGNNVQGNATVGIAIVGANTVVRSNIGYVTENSGAATILNGNISVTVNHGLSTNATSVLLTGTHAEVKDCIVTNITSTQFTITASANVTANRDIYWRAVVGAGN